jgi:hypothetical protein
VVHNPADTLLSSGLRAQDDGAIRLLSPDSQALDVPAGSWHRMAWRLSATQPGHGKLTFSFMPSSGVIGSWSMPLSVGNVANDTTYTAGVLTGERSVGVSVPSGLSAGQLKLEIRASNSLLGTLAGIANDLPAAQPSESGMNGVSQAAAQLSGPASIGIAFNRLEAPLPADLELTGVERSLLLQALYSAQRPDGSWSYDLAGRGAGSLQQTSEVLLALRRAGLYTASDGSQVQPDPTVLNRALTYVSIELARPISANSSSNVLDERAFALYVLSQHRSIPADWVRPLLAYTGSTGETGANANTLSLDGQAWLALALRQSGNSADAVALVDRILSQGSAAEAASAPMLEALVEAGRDVPADRTRLSGLPDYAEAARTYTHTLMENRMGSGWRTPSMTANSLWALGLHAVASGEKLQPGMPSLMLGDRAVQNSGQPGNSGTVSVVLSGNDLHPGVNWLKLMAPNSTQSLYYSLTLIATR